MIALRKARKSVSVPLSVKLPPKRVREKFLIIYELEGCQKAANFLTKYYGIKRIKIILNGRKVGNNYLGCYLENKAYFKTEGLNKRIVLHEFYHHLIVSNELELILKTEEREADCFAKSFVDSKKK